MNCSTLLINNRKQPALTVFVLEETVSNSHKIQQQYGSVVSEPNLICVVTNVNAKQRNR